MECSVLENTVFFPWKHDYTTAPCLYQQTGTVNIHPDDAWLLRHAPTLVLQPVCVGKPGLGIEPCSAARMLDNCAFDANGILSRISPAFLRAHAACWIMSKTQTRLFSAQPVYKTRHDSGGIRAAKSRYKKKTRDHAMNARKTVRQCQSIRHTNAMDDTICPRLAYFCDLHICQPCAQYFFKSPPVDWHHVRLLSTQHTTDFIAAMITPLCQYPLHQILLGAVFADAALCTLDPTQSLTAQYIRIAQYIWDRPELFIVYKYHYLLYPHRRLWGHILGLEECAILALLLSRVTQRKKPQAFEKYDIQLCTYQQLCAIPHKPAFPQSQKKIQTSLRLTTRDYYPQDQKTLSTEIPLEPFCSYRDPVTTATWMFTTHFIRALYTLAVSKQHITICLTASSLGNTRPMPADAVHPHRLQLTPTQTEITIHTSEWLHWRQICDLVCHPTLCKIRLLGSYSTARYGLKTPLACFTDGACFADLVDILGLNLAEDTPTLPVVRLLPTCRFELLPDLTQAHSVPSKEVLALERHEAQTWTSQSWSHRTLMSLVRKVHKSEHPIARGLQPHPPRVSADPSVLPRMLRNTLLQMASLRVATTLPQDGSPTPLTAVRYDHHATSSPETTPAIFVYPILPDESTAA
jgi:hypothetical protein